MVREGYSIPHGEYCSSTIEMLVDLACYWYQRISRVRDISGLVQQGEVRFVHQEGTEQDECVASTKICPDNGQLFHTPQQARKGIVRRQGRYPRVPTAILSRFQSNRGVFCCTEVVD